MSVRGFVLVGGWPASGKSTLSRALADELALPWLSKDEVKEALFDSLGPPASVGASRDLGRVAVEVLLRLARGCPGAVVDSTWYPCAAPLVRALPGPCVELRCLVPVAVARDRHARRAAGRAPGHLDTDRDDEELWGAPVPPLGAGPLVEVDTAGPVDVAALATRVGALLAATG